jgi:putative tryptophan/tyrosine transport system substrate-binding protein
MLNRRRFLATLSVSVVAAPDVVYGQRGGPKVGYLGTDPQAPSGDAFKQGLRDLGYVEGRNIWITWRFTGSDLDRLPELAAELAGLKPDVIVTTGASAVKALGRATTTTPIVMANYVGDPLADGIVRSLGRPGGNITGEPPRVSRRLGYVRTAIPTGVA